MQTRDIITDIASEKLRLNGKVILTDPWAVNMQLDHVSEWTIEELTHECLVGHFVSKMTRPVNPDWLTTYDRIVNICVAMDTVLARLGYEECAAAWGISRTLQENAQNYGERVYLPTEKQARVLAEAMAKAWFARIKNVELFRALRAQRLEKEQEEAERQQAAERQNAELIARIKTT
jgi:hypothetical protein